MTEPKTELQRNFLAGIRKKELDQFQRTQDMQWMDNRMEDGRMGRLMGLLHRESDMEKQYHERTDHAAIVNRRAAKETALAYEINKVRQEEITELQRRQFLRENDPQLKRLIKKLEAGYTCRDLKQQILNNEHKRLQEKADDIQTTKLVLNALDDQGSREAQKKAQQKAEYCRELQQQLVNKQRVKQCQYEETLIEKKMLDEVMRTISDEDQRELEQKRMQTAKSREEMKTFQQARLAWREKQKTMVINEEYRIEMQNKQMANRTQAIAEEKARIQKASADKNIKIITAIRAQEEEKKKRQDIITLLQEQEYIEKSINDGKEEKAKMARTKYDTKTALDAQMAMRKQFADEQAARDLEIRRNTDAKAIEDQLKEQEKKRLLREKNRRYADELLLQAEAHRAMLQAGRQDEENRAKAVQQYYSSWDKEVAKERQSIIQEHAPHVLGFLQVGVLKRDDLPDVRIGANRHENLASMNIEKMAEINRPKQFPKCNDQCMILREY